MEKLDWVDVSEEERTKVIIETFLEIIFVDQFPTG